MYANISHYNICLRYEIKHTYFAIISASNGTCKHILNHSTTHIHTHTKANISQILMNEYDARLCEITMKKKKLLTLSNKNATRSQCVFFPLPPLFGSLRCAWHVYSEHITPTTWTQNCTYNMWTGSWVALVINDVHVMDSRHKAKCIWNSACLYLLASLQ